MKPPLIITSKGKLIDNKNIRMIHVDKIRQAIQDMEDRAFRSFLEQSDEK